jgi:hypothetical protein
VRARAFRGAVAFRDSSKMSEFGDVPAKSRSIAPRLVFAGARGLQTGEGPMAEVELTRIAECRAAEGAADRRSASSLAMSANLVRSPTPCRSADEGATTRPSPVVRPPGRRGCGDQEPTRPRGARPFCVPPARTAQRAILGAEEEVPMRATDPPMGIAEERRPGRLGWRAIGARPSHHPAMAATARSRSALRTSNHSDMAAH